MDVERRVSASVILTERLDLFPVGPAELDLLARMWRDAEVRQYLGGPVPDEAIAERVELIRDEGMRWGEFAVAVRGGPTVGFCNLGRHRTGDIELSYEFLSGHWGHGYAREASKAVLSWGFASLPGAERIVAVTQAGNRRSRRLLEAIGMQPRDQFVEFGAPQVMYCCLR